MITIRKPANWKKLPLPFLNKWVTALRSGEFKQGKSLLKTGNDEYCCLGVLSHIQGRLTKNLNGWVDCPISPSSYRGVGKLLGDNPCIIAGLNPLGEFPPSIWLERRNKDGSNAVFKSLAYANDCGVSFAEIADILETLYQDAGE